MKSQVGGRRKTIKILFYIFIFFYSNANAATIYDFQIENLISNHLNLIQKNNEKIPIEYSVILDENPNAFINEKRKLFITTGLLKYAPSYKALLGVLAHELGHLKNFHITKRIDSIKKINTINQLSNISLIATSILSNNSDYLVQSLITNQANIKNYYSHFSREQEREADAFAADKLKELNISSDDLIKFLTFLEKKSFERGLNEDDYKFSSHPIYEERYKILQNKENNEYKFEQNSLSIDFSFSKAKLFGFTSQNENEFYNYLEGDYYNYANSILLSRKGKLKDSLKILNNIISKFPKHIFLIETKADLLLSHGFTKEAKKFYNKVLKIESDNIYVKKQIFNIEYDNYKKNTQLQNKKIFNYFLDLIWEFENDILLQKKFKDLAYSIKKDYWVILIEGNIFVINSRNDKAIQKYNDIINNSNDEKLKSYARKKVDIISNE